MYLKKYIVKIYECIKPGTNKKKNKKSQNTKLT